MIDVRVGARWGRLATSGALALAAMLGAPAARAVLGGDVSTIGGDQQRVKGERRFATALRVQTETHLITMADGSSIREYVTPGGIVFAVAWSTRFKPDLEALFGSYAQTYAAAAGDALKTPGIKRNVVLQRGDLVVQSTVHLNNFVGRAYLRSLVPQGIAVDELR